jgi:CBS domain-containing protein
MKQASDIMTRAVATVTPGMPVSKAAELMRDFNIGDVLVLDKQNDKLLGIVTDRDLTIKVLTNGSNSAAPVEKYMSTNVVTGSPDWSVDKMADVMGKNQIRRLPIVQDEHLVGIVSLGDLAVHTPKQQAVAKSLKNISEEAGLKFRRSGSLTKILAFAIPIAVGAAVLVYANTNSGKQVRRQMQSNELVDQARHAFNDALNTLQDSKTRQAALDAWNATGIPDKTGQFFQDGVRSMAGTLASRP